MCGQGRLKDRKVSGTRFPSHPCGPAGERNPLFTRPQNSVSHETLCMGGLSREVRLPSSLLKMTASPGPLRAKQGLAGYSLSPPRKRGEIRWQDGKGFPSPSIPARDPGVSPFWRGMRAAMPDCYEGRIWPGTSPKPHAEPTQLHLTQGKMGPEARTTLHCAVPSRVYWLSVC